MLATRTETWEKRVCAHVFLFECMIYATLPISVSVLYIKYVSVIIRVKLELDSLRA